ncbi:MAG: PAS domain S-box protein [Candidatus Thorarchaeota archaeon]|nr:PAS domain S-box protein [Candidatus Thorarchaeota archaeon]
MKTNEDWTVNDTEEINRQYRSTLDALDEPLHVVDNELHIILVNPAFEKWLVDLGLETDILGKRLPDAFSFQNKAVIEEYKRVFETGETVRTTERTTIADEIIDAEISKIPIFSEGRPIQVITVIRDITEKQKLLRAIRESELRYRSLFENTNDAVFLISLDGKHIEANQKAADLLGYEKEELIGLSVWDVVEESEGDHASSIRDKLLKGEEIPVYERTFRKKDGLKIIVELNFALAKDESGTPMHIQSVVRNISARKQAIENIARSEERLSNLISGLPEGIAIVDKDEHFTYVNKRFIELLGYDESELLSMSVFDLTAEAFTPRIIEESLHRTKGETSVYTMEMIRKDGEIRNFRISGIPWYDENGIVIGTLGVVSDITDSIKLQEAIKESESKHRMIFDSASDGILIHSMDGEFLAVNRVICDRLGYSREELLGMKPSDIDTTKHAVVPEGGLQNLREEGGILFETEHTRKDGTKVPTEISSRIIEYDGKPALLSIARDITERVAIETRFQMLSSAMSQSTEGLVILDMEAHILFCNKAFANLNGYELEELAGRHLSIVHDEDQMKVVLETIAEAKEKGSFSGIVWFTKKDRTTYPGRMRNTLIRNDEGEPYGYIGTLQDISAQLKAEQQLTKLSRAVEQSPASVIITDADGLIEYVNPKFTDLTGYSLEEAIGKNPRILKTDLTPVETHEDLWATILQGKEWHGIFANQKKNGELYWEEARISPILDASNNVTHFVAVKLDITQTRRKQQALQESEERLELALRGGNLGVWDWYGVDDRLIVDERYAGILGYEVDEIEPITKGWEKLLHPDDLQAASEKWDKHVAGESEFYISEYRMRTKSGDYKWVLESGRAVEVDEHGRTKRATGTLMDITETKLVEESLRKSEERFRNFFESEPNYCYMISSEGMILDANRAALERMGYSKEEMIGKPVMALYAEESHQKMNDILAKWKDKGEISDVELLIKTKSGEKRIVLLSSSAVQDKDDNIIHSLSTQKDITEIRNAQEELERSYRDLELYASLLQHDLRSDLQIILGHTEATLMTSESESITETYGKVVEASTLRMIRLLNAFQRPTREEERDLVKLIEKIAGIAETAQTGLGITIKTQKKPGRKRASAGRLLPMVFDNLFRNAYIYANKQVDVEVNIEFKGKTVIIDVSDNGPGIHEDVIDRLFEKGASTSRGGYGLHLSRKVIEGYGGTMELHSTEKSKGSTFRIILPLS